jgi:hypothetical protein
VFGHTDTATCLQKPQLLSRFRKYKARSLNVTALRMKVEHSALLALAGDEEAVQAKPSRLAPRSAWTGLGHGGHHDLTFGAGRSDHRPVQVEPPGVQAGGRHSQLTAHLPSRARGRSGAHATVFGSPARPIGGAHRLPSAEGQVFLCGRLFHAPRPAHGRRGEPVRLPSPPDEMGHAGAVARSLDSRPVSPLFGSRGEGADLPTTPLTTPVAQCAPLTATR